jgi:hypothetical protein
MMDWAERHLQCAETASEDFFRKGPYIVSCEYDVERSTSELGEWVYQYWVRKPLVEFSDDIPLHLGDAIHAMRVSLDYIAFAAVANAAQSNPTRPAFKERDIAFPIVRDPVWFDGTIGRCMPNVDRALVDTLRSFQPIIKWDGVTGPPLVVLDALEQPHKHRRLLSASVGIDYMGIAIRDGDAADVTSLPTAHIFGALQEKAELARLQIRCVDSKPKANVEAKATFAVLFDETGPAPRQRAIRYLRDMAKYIRGNVFPVFDAYV